MHLGKIASESGHELVVYDSLDSTNAEAIRQSRLRRNPNPIWVLAKRQTEGRGRHGRLWSSPPGNFYGSLLLKNPCEIRKAPQLGFVAGVALRAAFKQIVPSLKDVILKWPNDALLNGAKLAGILLESSVLTQTPEDLWVAIGVGINLAFHPDDTPYPATNLASYGAPVSLSNCIKCISDAFAQKIELYDKGQNFHDIRVEWLKAAHEIGTPIKIRKKNDCETENVFGNFGGIDETGSLILNQEDKGTLIHSGDVIFTV